MPPFNYSINIHKPLAHSGLHAYQHQILLLVFRLRTTVNSALIELFAPQKKVQNFYSIEVNIYMLIFSNFFLFFFDFFSFFSSPDEKKPFELV